MKQLIMMMTLAAAVTASAQAGQEMTDDYQLVWSDEFNGTSLDERAWNVEVNGNGGGNQELQYYTRDNVTIETEPTSGASCLTLTAARKNYRGKSFVSGRLNTQNKLFFTYGRVEARIMLPKTANGLWPAFWMLGNDFQQVGWPRCGEVDILEMGDGTGISQQKQEYRFNGACHWGYYNGQGQYPNYARSSNAPYSLQDGEFHLFTAVWDEHKIRMYLDLDRNPDASPYYEIGVESFEDDWGTGHYFNKDFFIVFDLAVGGLYTGILEPNKITALPNSGDEAKMYIDYVRIYQKNDRSSYITVPEGYSTRISEVAPSSTSEVSAVFDLMGRQLSRLPKHRICLVRTDKGVVKVMTK